VNEEIVVNGVTYTKKQSAPTGCRAVVVIDRGWIFAGDVSRANGRITLTRAIHVFRWEVIGFDGMLSAPLSDKVKLKQLENAVEIPEGSEIFCVPVCDTWGLK